MSISRTAESYPAIYEDLVRKVTEEGRAIWVTFPSKPDAIRLRQRFYGWRISLKPRSELFHLWAAASSIVLQITESEQGYSVVFSPVDSSLEAEAISAALKQGDRKENND